MLSGKCTKTHKCTELHSSFFSSRQGETGRPGMPGEKGDIGAVVGDFHHPQHTNTHAKGGNNHHVSLDLSRRLDGGVIQMM